MDDKREIVQTVAFEQAEVFYILILRYRAGLCPSRKSVKGDRTDKFNLLLGK